MERRKYHLQIILILIIGFLIPITLCNDRDYIELQDGDIIFQDLESDDFSDAVEAVTQSVGNRNFSHCGIICINDGQTPVDTFLKRSEENPIRHGNGLKVPAGMKTIP